MSRYEGNANLKSRQIDWDVLFMDYFSGMAEREIERKYELSSRQIRRQCRKILIRYIAEGGRFEKPVMEIAFIKTLDYDLSPSLLKK